MLKQLKQYILIVLCTALLHNPLLFSSTNTTEQQTVHTAENTEQLQDEKQLVEDQEENPSILTSWRKVITFQWKTLTKADAWNMSKSITAIGIGGLFYHYFAKKDIEDINGDNTDLHPNPNLFNQNIANYNVVQHNKKARQNTYNIDTVAPSEPIRRRNPACFFDYDVLPDDPQHLIALYMISDFLALPKTIITNKDKIFSTTISPDNTRMVSTTANNNVIIWSPYNHEFCIINGHTQLISSIAISPNNAYVITGSYDNTAKIWDIYTGQLKHTCIGHTSPIRYITISEDNSYMTTCSLDMVVKTWDIETGQLLQTAVGYTHHSNSLMAYCSNKVNVLYGPKEGTTNLINMITFKIRHTLSEPHNTIESAAISQDNAYIVLGLTNGTLKIIPLQLNLEEQESLTFTWIKNNILPCQAHLIIRACAATQGKNVLIINAGSDDAMVWITFPAYVRYYLRSRLNIQLKK